MLSYSSQIADEVVNRKLGISITQVERVKGDKAQLRALQLPDGDPQASP